jgi:cold shock CspA family protein/ribosome-associated translation inhibitor RaiA
MKKPMIDEILEVSFHGSEPSQELKSELERRVVRLQTRYPRITSWHVFIEEPTGTDRLFDVTIEVRVPGAELVVSRSPGDRDTHSDPFVALRHAFAAIERQLKQFYRQRQGTVKTPASAPQGRVVRLDHSKGHGFIAVNDGREVYFHKNAVIDPGFNDLTIGDAVALTIVYGESAEGPQATMVRRISPMAYDPKP